MRGVDKKGGGGALSPPFSFWLGIAALFAIAVAWQLPRIGRLPWVYDEGLILAGADRLLQGEIPYRDFWNTHPPGQIWLVADLFRLAGPSILALRLYDIVVRAALACVLFLLVRRISPLPIALAGFALAAAWLEYYPQFGYTIHPALLCGYGALAFIPPATEGVRARRLAGVGVLLGLALLFRLDFGAYAIASTTVLLCVRRLQGDASWASRARGTVRELLLVAAGATLAAGGGLVILLVQGVPLARLFDTLVAYPYLTFPEVRRLPRPPFTVSTFVYYVPALVCVLGLAVGATTLWRERVRSRAPGADGASPRSWRRPGHTRPGLAWLALALLPLAATPHTTTRTDLVHQAPLVLAAAPLACALLWSLWRVGRWWSLAPVLGGAWVVWATFVSIPLDDRFAPAAAPMDTTHRDLPRARGVALDPGEVAAARALRTLTAPGDAIYVGVGRHDHAVAGDALLYFLAGRRYATPYHNLLPGVVTREDVQYEIISELGRRRVRYLVLWTLLDGYPEPGSARLAGATALDAFIHRTYTLSAEHGAYQLWAVP